VKFSLGRLVATPGVATRVPRKEIHDALRRHGCSDWGELCEDDIESNNYALEHGYRLLSSYKSADGVRFWIITEADRSVTTVLLPEEY